MVVGVDVEAFPGHAFGKAGIAGAVLGKAVADKEDAARGPARRLVPERQRRAARAGKGLSF